jgi:hypothetical protein
MAYLPKTRRVRRLKQQTIPPTYRVSPADGKRFLNKAPILKKLREAQSAIGVLRRADEIQWTSVEEKSLVHTENIIEEAFGMVIKALKKQGG